VIRCLAIVVLESVRSEYERVLKMKNSLQRELEQCTDELITMKAVTNSLIDNLKEQTENISLEKVNKMYLIENRNIVFDFKERLAEENVALRDQVQQLKVDFQNSESVQHDFVKLSQALQVY
jgi:hypothetical protein